MIRIPLTRGLEALIDDEDVGLCQYNWYAYSLKNKDLYYARRNAKREGGRQRTILLHREILGITDSKIKVDHKDGDGLNCQRRNIRVATDPENARNRKLHRNNVTGFKGVSPRPPGRWIAEIQINKKRNYLGCYSSPEEAAQVYDEAAKKFFGEFAKLNFPDAML